jgi:hypothetical protein
MLCRSFVALVGVLILGPAVGIHAADNPLPLSPAPPATKPSAEETALRAALRSLATSLQDGDAEGIRAVIYAANPTERKMVDAMAAMAVEIARLHKAAAKAFGNEAAKELTGELGAEMARIDGAEITFDAPEAATVRYKAEAPAAPTTAPAKPDASAADVDPPPPPPAPLVLKKIEGKWRVPISELSKDTTPEEIEQRLADLDVQTKVIAELSGEIAKGKHKTAEKAAEAWQAKMMQALAPRKPEPKKPDEPAKPK